MRQLWIPLYHKTFIMTLCVILWALTCLAIWQEKVCQQAPSRSCNTLCYWSKLLSKHVNSAILLLSWSKDKNSKQVWLCRLCNMAPYEVILRKQKYLKYSRPEKNLNRIFLVIQLSVVTMTMISSTPPQFQRQLLNHSCHLHAFRSSPAWSCVVNSSDPKAKKQASKDQLKGPSSHTSQLKCFHSNLPPQLAF